MKSLSENIRAFRKANNLTQAELASKLDKAESTIRMWELNKASPDTKTLLDLAHLFGVTTDILLGNTRQLHINASCDEMSVEAIPKNKAIDKISKELTTLNPKQLKLVRDLVSEISRTEKK